MSTNETPLERLLRHAHEEPGLRPEFYRHLLEANVLVPVQTAPGQSVNGKLPANSELGIVTFVMDSGIEVVPFYSSPDRVYDASPDGEQCVVMRSRELFESFRVRPDMHFHLNPLSTYQRYFTPPEISALLARGVPMSTARQPIDVGDDVVPAESPNPPAEILDALRVCFARNLEVRAAYIAELRWPGENGEPRLLIAVDLIDGGDRQRILREVGVIMTETEGTDRRGIAFGILPRNGSRISRYFLHEAKPFYESGIAARLMKS